MWEADGHDVTHRTLGKTCPRATHLNTLALWLSHHTGCDVIDSIIAHLFTKNQSKAVHLNCVICHAYCVNCCRFDRHTHVTTNSSHMDFVEKCNSNRRRHQSYHINSRWKIPCACVSSIYIYIEFTIIDSMRSSETNSKAKIVCILSSRRSRTYTVPV